MATVSDAFTDTNGTNLGSHSPDGGTHTWTYQPLPGYAVTIESNEIQSVHTTAGEYSLSGTEFATDSVSYIEWRRTGAPAAGTEGLIELSARIGGWNFSGVRQGGYTARLELFGTTPRVLIKWNTTDGSGFPSETLATTALPTSLLDLATHSFAFEVHGTTLRVFIDGARALSVADPRETSGKITIAMTGNSEGSGATNLKGNNFNVADSGFTSSLTAATSAALSVLSRHMVPVPPTVFAFLTARHRPVPGALSLGGTGGSAPPIEGQLWPRGQKSG
jgi:hypothetical protein